MPTPLLDSLRRAGQLYGIAGPTGAGLRDYDDEPSRKAAGQIGKLQPHAIGIDASNVAQWMSDRGPDTDITAILDEPGLQAPWPVSWIEWDWRDDPLMVNSWPIKKAACLVEGFSGTPSQERVEELIGRFPEQPIREWATCTQGMTVWGPFLPWPQEPGAVIGPWGAWAIGLDDEGRPLFYDDQYIEVFGVGQQVTDAMERNTGKNADQGKLPVQIATLMALRTFQFANCQNVDLVEVEPRLSRQQRRHHERTGEPVNTWHELRIGAIGGQRATGPAGPSQGLVRQHICRGHFATYTEERKLFGKYAGRFWIPATVKGNPARGRADKGYVVEAPDAR